MYNASWSYLLTVIFTTGLIAAAGCSTDIPSYTDVEEDVLEGERINSFYTNEEIKFFLEVALDENDEEEEHPTLSKWTKDIRIALLGDPTPEDRNSVQQIINELNPLVRDINISISDVAPNVFMYFVHEDEYHFYEPHASDRYNEYQAWIYFDFGGGVEEVNILLPSDTDTTDYYRPPMIRATLSTALGFLGLSWLYPESIFYRYENLRTSFAPIDRTAIELMYLPELHVGMTRSQIIRALTNR